MKNARIIERTRPDGQKKFYIQRRMFLFWWIWYNVDMGLDTNEFWTLEEAESVFCWYDGTPYKDKVVK